MKFWQIPWFSAKISFRHSFELSTGIRKEWQNNRLSIVQVCRVIHSLSNFWTLLIFLIFLLISVNSPDIHKTVYSFYTLFCLSSGKKYFPARKIIL
ncbi:MAG: hypothetical protein GY795_34775 [Desulfobacterales bacterium]|nr:hypothetical protein [Desulfobacterales bacterium]